MGPPKFPEFRGEEESRREQEGDFAEKSPSASTANDDEVISSIAAKTLCFRGFCYSGAKSLTASLFQKIS